jgi:GTP-binding protein Era
MNALIGQPLAMVSPKAQATRAPVIGLRTEGDTQFVFHDLPGLLDPGYLLQSRIVDAELQVLAVADVVVHLHPASEAPAPPLASLIPAGARLPPVQLLAYTKSDLLGERPAPPGLVVSASTGEGLEALVAEIGRRLPEGEWQYPADDLGTQPVRFFVPEYLREAAFELLEDELPYAFTAEVEEFRENDDPVYIRATLYVERESQKRILIGAQGRTIKAIGQHARRRLEGLLGSRVYLDTRVKVLPKWRRSSELLARLGFPDSTRRSSSR